MEIWHLCAAFVIILILVVFLIVKTSGPFCPHCKGLIVKNATVCKHCARSVK